MRAIDFLTEEDYRLRREYVRLQYHKKLAEATQEMRDANNKYNRAIDALTPFLTRYGYAKASAKRRGIPFEITREQFVNLCEATIVCPILLIPLDYSVCNFTGRGKKQKRDDSASLDRIDSSKGYTIDNVWIISWRANSLKKDGSLQEFKALVEALERLSNVTNV